MTAIPGPGEPEDRDDFGDPKAIDAAFDEIVAHIDHPDTAASTASWPESEGDVGTSAPVPQPDPSSRTPRSDWPEWDDVRAPLEESVDETEDDHDDDHEDEGHYVPPPPPPIPRGDNTTRWAWAGAVGAPILAILLPLIGWGIDGLVGLLLVGAFLAGFVTLISRLRNGPRIDEGPDDGAVV